MNDNTAPTPLAAAVIDTSPANAAPPTVPHPRTIRSFVRRTGRTTLGQAKAFVTQGPQFLVNYTPALTSIEALFGRNAPTILEIGFGMGEATAHIAALMACGPTSWRWWWTTPRRA